MEEKYIPLYRKYRPQKLEELVGQEHIKNALKNAIELNKISHAYLFTGPRGTGKTSTARIFAKSLNCKNGPTISPCGICESCQDITNTIPLDVVEIDAASNRKVEDTQNILEKILYAPVYGKYKIYIIDEVHMLSTTAFNSLLKTLEEPPENVIFILATTEVHKVLDTIKSRCQRFDFRRITTEDIVNHLKSIAQKENINITDDALNTIAKNSAGGMRDSIALLDQVSILSGETAITTDDINKLLGRISFDILAEISEFIIKSDSLNALEILEKIYNNGNEPVQILTNLLDYLKNILIVKNCRQEIIHELTQLNNEQLKIIKSQAEGIETHQIISLINKCYEYIKDIKTTNNPRLWLEVAIIDFANLQENTQIADLQRRISDLENGAVSVKTSPYKTPPAPVIKPNTITPAPKQEKQSETKPMKTNNTTTDNNSTKEEEFSPIPKPEPQNSSNDLSALWTNLIENVSSAPTRSLLKQWANPVELNSEKVIISINSENLLKQFVEGNKRNILADAVNKVFSHTNITVRLPQSEDTNIKFEPAKTQNKPIVPKQENINDANEDENLDDVDSKEIQKTKKEEYTGHSDMVNMTLEVFEGKIIE